MQQYRKNLGKVSLTAEGAWNLNNSYDILSIVYDEHTQHGFISRKAVPQGVDLYNKEYWMPLNVSGYVDNNVIILSKKTSDVSIQSYTLEEAIASIKSVGRRPGAILGFYNENNDRLDIGGRWELWQFNDTNVYNWENVDSWQNLYYNYNKFMGWFKDENFLTKYAPFPEIGCYAFVGSEFNEATVYRCDNKYVWNNTTQHAWDYVKVIVDGNVTVGKNGNWFNNGEDTGIPASVKGENGKTPVFREKDNTIQYSFDNVNWITISNKIAAWFRWNATTGDTQANNVGRIQISRDNVTWTNLSGDIINNLHISRYIGADEPLPTSGIAEGTIYAKGPRYDENDVSHANPIYRLWVYAWKGNTLAWQDNGEFTSIAAGVVQETGDSETEVMSQKAVSEKLSELGKTFALGTASYFKGNTVYISSIIILDNNGKNAGRSIPINNTFTVESPYVLVYNDNTNTVSVVSQDNVLKDDYVLLWRQAARWGGNTLLRMDWFDQEIEALKKGQKIVPFVGRWKGSAFRNNTASWRIGDIYYNTNTKIFRKVEGLTDAEGNGVSEFSDVLPQEGILYECGGFYFSWDGTDLYAVNSKTHTFDVELTSGQFSRDNGQIFFASTAQIPFYCALNRKHLKFDGRTDTLLSVECEDIDNLIMCTYDEDLKVIDVRTAFDRDVSTKARYIRFGVERKEEIDYTKEQATRHIKVTINSEKVEWVRGDGAHYNVDEYPKYRGFQYELSQVPIDDDNIIPTSEYIGNNVRAINSGYIYMPKNYKNLDKPVPLIIFFNGTEGFTYTQTNVSEKWQHNISYLCNMGYAVASCSTFTNLYTPNAYGSLDDVERHELNPSCNLAYQCYIDLYNYVVENFNVEKEVHVFGKSAGGLISAIFSNTLPFPIKSVAELAPSLDIYTNFKILAFPYDINWWAERLGMKNPNIEGSGNYSEKTKEYLKTNYKKIIGHNPLWLNTSGLNIAEVSSKIVDTKMNEYENNSSLVSLFDDASKVQKTPMKIWHAVDDVNVPIATSRFYVKMAQNGGCQCYLREMPSGSGQHSIDNKDMSPSMTVPTIYGGNMVVPITLKEMVDWFKRWD